MEVLFMATHSISEEKFVGHYQTGVEMCGQANSSMLAECLEVVSAV